MRVSRQFLKSALLVSAAIGSALPAIAHAQTPSPSSASVLEEVVVTARKREESLQQIPVAVSAVSGAGLEKQGIRQTTDLGRIVPSLTVAPVASQNSAAVFGIRGQAAGDVLLTYSQPVGVYIDTVNVPHPIGLQGSFFDIERVEVLKGPQGTLYGRNTTGGAVNIITRNADYNGIHGFGYGEVGNYNDWRLGGAINVPIIHDQLAARIAYQHWNRDGYGRSSTTGQKMGGDHDDDIVRGSLRFDPSSYFSSTTKFEYVRLDQAGQMPVLLKADGPAALEAGFERGALPSGPPPLGFIPVIIAGNAALAPIVNTGDLFSNASQSHQFDREKVWHFAQDMTWNIAEDLSLRSITGYHKVTSDQGLDLDASPFQILEVNEPLIPPFKPNTQPKPHSNNYYSWTQEFDLSGNSFDRLNWLVGAFWSEEKGSGQEASPTLVFLTNGEDNVSSISNGYRTSTAAIYGQGDIKLSDRVSVTLGLRYTEEKQKNASRPFLWFGATGTVQCTNGGAIVTAESKCPESHQAAKSNGTSYLLSYNFQATPDWLFYLKTARGFRGGALQFRSASLPGAGPETATDYEAGFKGDFFDKRLRTNLAVYQTNYENKQETVIIPISGAGGGLTTVIANAASARIRGFEAEVTAQPMQGWSVYGTLTYLDGEYLDYANPLSTAGVNGFLFGNNPACVSAAGVPQGPPFAAQCIAHNIPYPNPKWRYSLGTRYDMEVGPGRLGGQLDWSWYDETRTTVITANPYVPAAVDEAWRESRGLLNARLDYTLADMGLTVALFGTNVLDEKYMTPGLPIASLGIVTGYAQEPRMWGVSVRKTFGAE